MSSFKFNFTLFTACLTSFIAFEMNGLGAGGSSVGNGIVLPEYPTYPQASAPKSRAESEFSPILATQVRLSSNRLKEGDTLEIELEIKLNQSEGKGLSCRGTLLSTKLKNSTLFFDSCTITQSEGNKATLKLQYQFPRPTVSRIYHLGHFEITLDHGTHSSVRRIDVKEKHKISVQGSAKKTLLLSYPWLGIDSSHPFISREKKLPIFLAFDQSFKAENGALQVSLMSGPQKNGGEIKFGSTQTKSTWIPSFDLTQKNDAFLFTLDFTLPEFITHLFRVEFERITILTQSLEEIDVLFQSDFGSDVIESKNTSSN